MQKVSIYGVYDKSVNDFVDFLPFVNQDVLKRTLPNLLSGRLSYILKASDDFQLVELAKIDPDKVLTRDVIVDFGNSYPHFNKASQENTVYTKNINKK